MSHFTVLIIGENPEEQLRPFDENLDVPRYVKYTKQSLIEKERNEIQEYAKRVYQKYLDNPTEYAVGCSNQGHLDYLQNEFPKKLNYTDEELYQQGIKYENESDIGADGEVYSEYNPNSKWDWYQLGGRWAGLIKVKDGIEFKKPNFSWGWDHSSMQEVLETKSTDFALKKDIVNLDEIQTFAVIKDGKWYERGEMGWWGIVSDEKDEDEWKNQFKSLLNDLPDETLLSVYDCHI